VPSLKRHENNRMKKIGGRGTAERERERDLEEREGTPERLGFLS